MRIRDSRHNYVAVGKVNLQEIKARNLFYPKTSTESEVFKSIFLNVIQQIISYNLSMGKLPRLAAPTILYYLILSWFKQ